MEGLQIGGSTMRLLSVGCDAKTIKGEKRGYLTGILYLAPAESSGHNVCTHSSVGCRKACLFTAGRASIFPAIIRARKRKTRALFRNRPLFLELLASDIVQLVAMANRRNLIPCVRLNGTSDLPWLARTMAKRFPHVQFYDYTKHPRPWLRTLGNYALTFSLSEDNKKHALDALANDINVAVVFNVKRGQPLPSTWEGYPVVDGDLTDLRFLDNTGVIVGLRAKGMAKHDCSGFVQI